MKTKTDDGALVEMVAAVVLVVGLLLWWLVRHPRFTLTVGTLVGSFVWLGPWLAGQVWLVVGLLLAAWWANHPRSFGVVAGNPVRSAWRRWWVYGRRWPAMTGLTDLAKNMNGEPMRPRIVRVRSSGSVDAVEVRMRAGQDLDAWEKHTQALAQTFGAISCRIRPLSPGRLMLEFKTKDHLADVIPALPVPSAVRLDSVAIGRTETGEVWRVPLISNHIFIAGRTGAGKGSVLWGILLAVASGIRSGLVEVWVCDPKQGMEFAFGREMFARFEFETEPMVKLLEDAVVFMQARADRLRGRTRLHGPTVDDPLLIIVIDEMAAVIDVLGTKEQRRRADEAIRVLIQQGRAIGVLVIGAVQDPGKDGVPFRNLFTVRIALGLNEPTEADMVLGKGARNRGALCDHIPITAKGVGYVILEGEREPTRVRAGHVTDPIIREVAALYPAPSNTHPEAIEADVIELHPQDSEVSA